MESRLYGLDALRGLAAFVVLAGHVLEKNDLPAGPYGIAVDFFFMLSGYVMARTYEHRMPGPVRFLGKRFRRLFAASACGAALAAIVVILNGGPLPWAALMAALLFLPLPGYGTPFPLNSPRWSLFFELIANVVHAAVFAKLNNRMLVAIAIALWFVLAAVSLDLTRWPVPTRHSAFLAGFARSFFAYTLGILLFRWNPTVPQLPTIAISGLFLAGFALDLLLPHIFFSLVFVTVICPVVMLLGAKAKVGNHRVPKAIGAISYPLYATHSPTMGLLVWAGMPTIMLIPTAIVCVAGIAIFLVIRRDAESDEFGQSSGTA